MNFVWVVLQHSRQKYEVVLNNEECPGWHFKSSSSITTSQDSMNKNIIIATIPKNGSLKYKLRKHSFVFGISLLLLLEMRTI